MDGIQTLHGDPISRLRSGIAITSISQCVEELVFNAVDANATKIAVRVDPSICKVQVIDNGNGIGQDQMERVAYRYLI